MMEMGGEAKGASDSGDDVDARTIFVRSLPFSLTDSQLEDIFSEVGPVRHCFTVKEKGSDQHRGFGFVQFAVTEDAHRAVQQKNGALLQGRKVRVEVAKRRAPLDVRLPKSDPFKQVSTKCDDEQPSKSDSSKVVSRKRKSSELRSGSPVEKASSTVFESKKKAKPGGKPVLEAKTEQEKEFNNTQGSSKQRSARTVVVGGLASNEMLQAVLAEAKKAGSIETIQNTLTDLELSGHGLAKDGCKPRAAAIVFLSVKAAHQAVAMLHQKTISGGVVWARQLGGEGSKLKQLRLIVRNLPFQVSEATLRELFSPAGFLWEVTIPRKPDGLSKGFAFIGFTSKLDAEKAIKLVNGKLVAKRPVAVDWTVAKKQYEAAVTPAMPVAASDVDLDLNESESTASESESEDKNVGNDDYSGSNGGTGDESEHRRHGDFVVEKQPISDDRIGKLKKPGKAGLMSKEYDEELDGHLNKSGDIADKCTNANLEMDRMEEIDMVKTILTKVVTSVHDYPSDDEEIVDALPSEHPGKRQLKTVQAKHQSTKKVSSNEKTIGIVMKAMGDQLEGNDMEGEERKLIRTVFIRNLPPEAKVPELRKLFSKFGEIKSFRLVLHPVTRRSKGNAFLEYAQQEAAQAAVAVAAKGGVDGVGLMLKGRALSVSMAVDKDSARKIAKETFHKQVEEDRRNLALAKEGQILMGTSAAEGVSKKDMAKRQQLEHEKTTKLRSPNFHVSRMRLLVHNVPKTMTEKELKKLFIEGVKSRASKQNPVIKQVKILRDEDSQQSRGVAFVEFTEHQHALVALRVLNNNPGTFSLESRPIVEFAIENSLILRKRAANAVQVKNRPSKGGQGKRTSWVNNVGQKEKKDGSIKNQKIRRREDHEEAPENSKPQLVGKATPVKKDRKRKRGEERQEARKTSMEDQSGGNVTAVIHSPPGDLQNGFKPEIKGRRKVKRGKTSGADRKAAQARRASAELTEGSVQSEGYGSQPQSNFQELYKKQKHQYSQGARPVEKPKFSQQEVPLKEGKSKNSGLLQSKGSNRKTQLESKRQSNKQRYRGKGGDTNDKLEKLVAEYQMKYFSGGNKPTASKTASAASGDLRRWFE